jgi:peptidoglycan/LPS O-acetylase OafA/YrhL
LHIARLQSLRGLAALAVLIGHALIVFPNGLPQHPGMTFTPASVSELAGLLLFQPNTAVIFFYVLSGFVLGLSLRRSPATDPRGYVNFLARRALRMAPMMWVSTILMSLILLGIGGAPQFGELTGTFKNAYFVPINPTNVALNLGGLRTDINGVLWSVQVELAMAFVLPLFAAIQARTKPLIDVAVVAGLYLLSLSPTVPVAFQYAYCFYLGMLLHKALLSPACTPFLRSGGLTAAALALLVPIDLLWHLGWISTAIKFAANAAIAAQVVGYLVARPDGAVCLDHRALVYLGDISYSLYVLGQPVLMLCAFVLLRGTGGPFSNGLALGLSFVMIVVCVPLVIALAALTFRRVERPFMGIARNLGRLPVSGPGDPLAADANAGG